jgi:hypothetical protein
LRVWRGRAPRHWKLRDRYLGWSDAARERNVRLLAYNPRFLILPWIRVPHLASHILGRMAKIVSADWQRIYAHPIYWLETFVGYLALSGHVLSRGELAGDRHDGRPRPSRAPLEQTRPVKQMLGLPLHHRFREILSQ